MTVFLHHCNDLSLDGGALALFGRDIGHSAVVIFFVLSGYVISATQPAAGRALDYGIKRAARVYSVAVPAILLTWVLDFTASRLGFADYSTMYQLHKPWIYLPIALTFTGNMWYLSEPAFSNAPYWSLDYEVWYYVIFGIAVFARGPLRGIGLSLVLVGMGPKQLLLFPIWLGGVAVCKLQQIRIPSVQLSRVMVAASIL
jgi:peptidoglycan/LPS O-acetylase OafA/YrhL